jgi:hypothetical protein
MIPVLALSGSIGNDLHYIQSSCCCQLLILLAGNVSLQVPAYLQQHKLLHTKSRPEVSQEESKWLIRASLPKKELPEESKVIVLKCQPLASTSDCTAAQSTDCRRM